MIVSGQMHTIIGKCVKPFKSAFNHCYPILNKWNGLFSLTIKVIEIGPQLPLDMIWFQIPLAYKWKHILKICGSVAAIQEKPNNILDWVIECTLQERKAHVWELILVKNSAKTIMETKKKFDLIWAAMRELLVVLLLVPILADRCPDTQIHKYTSTLIHKYTDTLIQIRKQVLLLVPILADRCPDSFVQTYFLSENRLAEHKHRQGAN